MRLRSYLFITLSLTPSTDFVWQALYWKLILIDRRKKIESGQRTTSLTFLLNHQSGAIGKILAKIKPERRELYFMFGQFGTFILFPYLTTDN